MLYAFVKAPIAPLYLRPESPCELADEALCGWRVEVLEQLPGGWCQVKTHYRYTGFTRLDCLTTPLPEGETEAFSYLKKLCDEGYQVRYGQDESRREQLRYEQDMIEKMGANSVNYRVAAGTDVTQTVSGDASVLFPFEGRDQGIRDPYMIRGSKKDGSDANKVWILATDLNTHSSQYNGNKNTNTLAGDTWGLTSKVGVGSTHLFVYETEDFDSGTEIFVTIINPQGEKTEERLHASAPGSYTAKLSTPQAGLYRFHLCRTRDGEIQNYMTAAAAVQFSDEYKFDVSAASYMKFVQQYGRLVTAKDKIWTRIAAGERESYPLANWLLAFAVVLFLADVAVRRLQYVPKRLPFLAAVRHIKEQKMPENTDYETPSGNVSSTAQKQTVRNAVPQKKKRRQSRDQDTLDTSQLLKKREERNQPVQKTEE